MYDGFFCRKTAEEILEKHIKDLQQQLKTRDELIDQLRNDITHLEEEKVDAEQRVSFKSFKTYLTISYDIIHYMYSIFYDVLPKELDVCGKKNLDIFPI